MADTSVEMILGMPFLTLSNADMTFAEERAYLEALPRHQGVANQQTSVDHRKAFASMALDAEVEVL